MSSSPSLDSFGTALITDCLGRFGGMRGDIRLLVGERVAGKAMTVQVVPGENGTIHRAVARATAGSVLVVAAGGGLERAVWGEVLARAAVAKGIAGVVIDGAVRDLEALRTVGLPTFALGAAPLGPHKGWAGRIGAPVACAGVVVHDGDLVVGDGDGVAVIPAADVERTRELASARQALEAGWLERIARGESTVDILGLEEPR